MFESILMLDKLSEVKNRGDREGFPRLTPGFRVKSVALLLVV
jgi:hypothetical protein